MSDLKWYVLKVIYKQEEKVKAYLEADLAHESLSNLVDQIYIPYEKVYEVRAGKKQLKNRPIFGGYVYLHADVSDGRLVQIIKNIPGALGFLSNQGGKVINNPTPLRKSEVDRIIDKTDEGRVLDLKLKNLFAIGGVVEIIDGPFLGFTGKIQEIFEERKTLSVIVKIFDERSTPVELSYVQVKKLS